jgi:hypothetical protein
MNRSDISAQLLKRGSAPEEWRVEAIGAEETTIFVGADAEVRAVEYAEARYATWKIG